MLSYYVLYCYLIPLLAIYFIPGLFISYLFKFIKLNKAAYILINFLAYSWMKIFLWTTGRKLIYLPNGYNLDNRNRFIICNHTNSLEVPFVVAIPGLSKDLSFKLSYLGGDIIFRYWILPLMMHAHVVDAVKYSDKNPNFRNFKKEVLDNLKEKSIFLFPEGKRTYSEEIQALATGVLKLAFKFKVDLDVFVISGMMGYSSDSEFESLRKSKLLYFKYCGSVFSKDYTNFESMREVTERMMVQGKKELDQKYK